MGDFAMTITFIELKERGATPGLTKRVLAASTKKAGFDAAIFDNENHATEPFTESFRQAGGFPKRRGQNLSPGSKGFKRSYYGRKLSSPTRGGGKGLALPNVNTGESLRRMAYPRTFATSKEFGNRYQARALNFKNPRSQVHPIKEVTHRLPKQISATVHALDKSLDGHIARDVTTKTTKVS